MVVLGWNYTGEHVLGEFEAYQHLVTPGSYIAATGGVMQWMHDISRGVTEWSVNNPRPAVHDFARKRPDFVFDYAWPINESPRGEKVTHWPDA